MKTAQQIIQCLALLGMLIQARASTLLYFEGFETNGWNGWTNDTKYTIDTNYAWVITAPTNGPGSAHGGSNCACTYGPGTDCYLVSPPLLMPWVDQYSNHLWLYYWQWQVYSNTLTYACLSDVKIREYQPLLGTWGPWNLIDPGTSGVIDSSQPCWRRRGIDLTLFAMSGTNVVQLGFGHGGLGNPGWFVDDIEIWDVPVATNLPDLQGFEGGWADWYNDRLCAWDIGIPTGAGGGPTNAPAGLRCAGTGLGGVPPPEPAGVLWTPAFYAPSLRPGERLYLQFDQWWDYGVGGMPMITWSYWFPSIGWWYPQNLTQSLAIGSPHTWQTLVVNIGTLAGNPVPVRLGFDAYATYTLGWFIDNAQIILARFQIVSILRQTNDICLTWTAPLGTTNVVQCSDGAMGNFTNLSSPIVASGAAQPTLSYTHPGAATNAARQFYRIRQL
jgi:hypothetical protein